MPIAPPDPMLLLFSIVKESDDKLESPLNESPMHLAPYYPILFVPMLSESEVRSFMFYNP